MAGSSGDDIPVQLAALLDKKTVRFRKTDEIPPRISVLDVVQALTGSYRDARRQQQYLFGNYPEVAANWGLFKFPGRWQRDTKVTDVRGAIEIIMLLPSGGPAPRRRQTAEHLARYLGGDLSIIEEVFALRGVEYSSMRHEYSVIRLDLAAKKRIRQAPVTLAVRPDEPIAKTVVSPDLMNGMRFGGLAPRQLFLEEGSYMQESEPTVWTPRVKKRQKRR